MEPSYYSLLTATEPFFTRPAPIPFDLREVIAAMKEGSDGVLFFIQILNAFFSSKQKSIEKKIYPVVNFFTNV